MKWAKKKIAYFQHENKKNNKKIDRQKFKPRGINIELQLNEIDINQTMIIQDDRLLQRKIEPKKKNKKSCQFELTLILEGKKS